MNLFRLRKFSSTCLLAVVACAVGMSQGASAAQRSGDLKIVSDGKSPYSIVLASDAIPAERTAAGELQKYIQEATGAELPIKNEADVSSETPQILVGPGPRAKKLLPSQNWNDLKGDGILIAPVGDSLVIAGDRPRGTLYAVFEFLERELGIRWWSPTVTKVPQTKNLTVKAEKYTYRPPFVYREHYSTLVHGMRPERYILGARYRQNGIHQYLPEEWGGHYSILGEGHTFSRLVPMADYFKDHPEYYSDPANGNKPCTSASAQPEPDGGVKATQLCLTNPEVVEIAAATALRWIEENPSAGIISITENDNSNYCACDKCTALAEKEGSVAGPLLYFVNKVADKIHDKYPDFLVDTFAYNQGFTPPRTIKPADNVLIRLAPLKADFGHPLDSEWNGDSPGSQENVRDGLRRWAAISQKLFLWNYITNFVYTIPPFPNWEGLDKDLRFFADNKVVGVFQQGDAITNDVGDMTPLRAYVVGKLMWNPKLDQEALINEFLEGYYGKAAPFLREYVATYQKSFMDQNRRLSSHDHDFSFLTLDVLTKANELFDKASEAVKDNPELLARVERERFAVRLSWLYRYKALKQVAAAKGIPFAGPKDPLVELDELDKKGLEYEIRGKGEAEPFEKEVRRLQLVFSPNSVGVPEEIEKSLAKGANAETDIIELQFSDLVILREGIWTNIVDDPKASRGKALQMQGGTNSTPVQFDLVNYGTEFFGKGKWTYYAVVRTDQDPSDKTGIALATSIYSANKIETGTTGVIIDEKIPAAETADGEYHVIKLGSAPLWGDARITFSSSMTPNVKALYIDRLFLVRETPLAVKR